MKIIEYLKEKASRRALAVGVLGVGLAATVAVALLYGAGSPSGALEIIKIDDIVTSTALPEKDCPPGAINVNTASASELEQLPGIGPVLAEDIIEHREANGPFVVMEDLLDVDGIGEGKLSDIRGKAVVSGNCPPGEDESVDAAGDDSDPGLINVNTASASELEKLPGVGEKIAGWIVDYREANGPFANIEDLIKVKGIGEKRLADIKEHAVVS